MKQYFLFSSIFIICLFTCCNSTQTLIHTDAFKNTDISKNWEVLNTDWFISNEELHGIGNQPVWSVILSKKKLPENYILEFSSWIETDDRLLEVILNLHEDKFVGLLMNYLGEGRVEFEDRTLYMKEKRFDIKTMDNIGTLPEVSFPKKFSWNKWKIQKTGNELFVWINDEEIIMLDGSVNILKDGGFFGFATSGRVKIKDLKLTKSKLAAPENLKGKQDLRFFFLFGE